MGCPREIAEVVAEIIETGILRIRSYAWSSESERCAIEADHIHNLPAILMEFSLEKLGYYWDVERASYVDQTPSDQLPGWEPLWERLRDHLRRDEIAAPAR